jgi:hypothetical protein
MGDSKRKKDDLKALIEKRWKREPLLCQASDELVIEFNPRNLMHCMRAGIIPKELANYVMNKLPDRETLEKIAAGNIDGLWEAYDAIQKIICITSIKPKIKTDPPEKCDIEKNEMSWEDLSDQEVERLFIFARARLSGGDIDAFRPFRDKRGRLVPLSDVPGRLRGLRAEANNDTGAESS